MRFILCACLIILCLSPCTQAQEEKPKGTTYRLLTEYGPIGTTAEAEATFRKALDELTAANGGVLIVPQNVAKYAVLENTARWSRSLNPESASLNDWQVGNGVLVVDLRGGSTRLKVPQVADLGSRGGLVLNRVLRMDKGDSLQHWTEDAVLSIENDVIHGPVNYLDWIVAPVEAGENARFYVPQVRNIFPGMYLNAHRGPGYSGGVARITVKEIGYDHEKKLYYFTAATNLDHVTGAIVQNKSHTPALRIQNNYHASNQTFDFYLERNQYGNGDSYLVNATYGYMGNVHSMAGDENGQAYVAYIRSLTNVFRGEVAEVDTANGTLTFTPNAQNAHTLGNSRPLINLNPEKWITAGSVMIVPAESYSDLTDTGKYRFQGRTYPTRLGRTRGSNISGLRMGGLIRFSADAPIDDSVIGMFFAVDEPTEYVPGDSPQLRRWYEITTVTANDDGTKDIEIQRFYWGAKDAGSPTLYNPDNFTYDGHERPLKYIIAPGAFVNDLREAVGTEKDRSGIAPRRLGITPPPVAGTPRDFAPGDRIEQAIGPDPFKPQAFRGWSFDHVPGAWPSGMIELANMGSVARHAALIVQGGPATAEGIPGRYEKRAPWHSVVEVNSAVDNGLVFNGDTLDSAILFKQPTVPSAIAWEHGARSPGRPVKQSRLSVDRQNGNFHFEGGALQATGGIIASGLSADARPAQNLRGKNVVIEAGAQRATVAFPRAELDADYAVFVEQSWLGNRAIVEKTAAGFTVEFDTAAPANATLDWMLVR